VEGLAESWSSYITLGPGGKVWVSHGGINEISWLDGLPGESGRLGNTLTSPGPDLKVYESESGQLWSLHSNGIQLFQHGRWVKFFIDDIHNPYLPDNILRKLTPFVTGGENEAYYLLPDRLVHFEATREFRETVIDSLSGGIGGFSDMISSRESGIWITGSKGVARYSTVEGEDGMRWQNFDLGRLELTDFRRPVEGVGGELLVLGKVKGKDAGYQAVRFKNGQWSIVPNCSGDLEAVWPGLNGSYWILKKNNQLVTLKNGVESYPEKRGMLAAEIRDVAVDNNGAFWLSSSHGVARYTPSLWRLLETGGQKLWIHSILEDSSGVMWFACRDRICKLADGVWKEYPMPDGLTCQPFGTQSILSLPDGRLAVGIMPYQNFLLTFDPVTERFVRQDYRNPRQPSLEEHTNIGMIAPYDDGRILLETRLDQEPSGFKLELFDGENFDVLLDQSQNLDFGNPRHLFKSSDGILWIAGQYDNGALMTRQGEFKLLDVDPQFKGNGFFAICEVEPGKIWIGGREHIIQYHKGEWSSAHSGMASVRSIFKSDDGTVWVASGTGVHRFSDGKWVTNMRKDGLPNDGVFSIFQDSKDKVWAGTIGGISLYAPDADIDPPQTLIFESRNLRESPPGGEVRLVYSGIDKWNHTAADRLLFSYRLDKEEWSEFKPGNMAVFSSLPYGRHFFEVRAMDVNYNIDSDPARFEFTVLLPWYREAGFQWIMGIGTAIILFLIGLALHRHILLEKLVIIRTNDLQTANVRLQNNLGELIVTQQSLEEGQQKLEIALGHESLLAGIASLLNSTVNLPHALQEVMDTIAVRLNLTTACLTNLEESSHGFFDHIISGNRESSLCAFHWSGNEKIIGSLERDGDYSVAEAALSNPEIIGIMQESSIEALSILPISNSEGIIGIACFCRREKYEWPAEERELLGTAVNMISSAWERHNEFQARLLAEKKQYEALQIADKASRMASIGVISHCPARGAGKLRQPD
jgi:ligand-binding sensor domain-containing protein